MWVFEAKGWIFRGVWFDREREHLIGSRPGRGFLTLEKKLKGFRRVNWDAFGYWVLSFGILVLLTLLISAPPSCLRYKKGAFEAFISIYVVVGI